MDFINVAFAQDAASTLAKQSSGWTGLLPLVLIMVVFYFLIIRPQQKKIKDHQNMIKAVKKGDKVVTAGGIFAKVIKIDTISNFATLEIAEKVEIKIRPDMISEVLNEAPIKPAKA
ncbi:MAG: preprotein translocase subunit YajC [Alphaproteobacteria bacterium]|jgi:preprotein translocase subunit YajC|nr:preprotein translocase subunit YajC [Candidatus Jidaibacter sp.]